MFDWMHYLSSERQRDLLNESAERRLILEALEHQALENRPETKSFAFYAPALAWVGHQMHTLGDELEQRYGTSQPMHLTPSEANR